MNDEVNSVVDNFINAIADENLAQAKTHFDALMGDKSLESLEQERVNVASNMFVVSNDDIGVEMEGSEELEDLQIDQELDALADEIVDELDDLDDEE